ncbi:tripartite tricarboxylate transporter substrate binding protein [Bacillus sp. ISL-47]|uniref:tripartite tricarboxylate transporter substrate binding protein n=1 Tax=Bacillus sp. ISL-47 TaxID=2819130 RepID=UPI001BE8DF7F|nr:tripartite tricarboxylate transporter substrate binding protein [Bacillus sp. ISL-47]MBT2689844.1 tripartite tricarboxylate transporter substrate binding protein [Bacillus sp. ISL-47]MBT2710221.1 tripartite tricarboxylate transporter substrate binding protein [Pseudomonas sp. ISL-84]
MKKKWILFVLMVSLVLFTAACSSSSSNASTKEGAENASDKDGGNSFPEKSITLIVPYAAGGGTDATARALAKAAEKHLGQSIGVVNKTGGNAVVGISEAANAKPDGYTIIMNANEIALLPHMGLTPITYEDFAQVAHINFDPSALTVPADAPYDTLEEFLAYAKENPGKIRVGGTGKGGIWHLGSASIEKAADVQFNYVPFDGAAPAKTALLGGHIEAITVSPAEVLAQVEAGELKTLGVLSDERSTIMPDVPTFKEAGYEANVGVWRAIDAPSDTPPEVVKVLEEAFSKAVEDEEFVDFMNKNGLGIAFKGTEEYKELVAKDHEFFGGLLKELGITQ